MLALVLPLTIWVSGAPFAVAIVGVFVYRILAQLLPMPVSRRSVVQWRAGLATAHQATLPSAPAHRP
ncbi:MAG TPA: hypothetical protein VGM53_34985 [Streptosporangiaceae bacterium]